MEVTFCQNPGLLHNQAFLVTRKLLCKYIYKPSVAGTILKTLSSLRETVPSHTSDMDQVYKTCPRALVSPLQPLVDLASLCNTRQF